MLSQMDRIRSFTAFILSRTAFTMFVNLLVTEERMPDSTVAKCDLMAFQIVEMRFFELFICFWIASFIPWKQMNNSKNLIRSEEHTSELQSRENLVFRL